MVVEARERRARMLRVGSRIFGGKERGFRGRRCGGCA